MMKPEIAGTKEKSISIKKMYAICFLAFMIAFGIAASIAYYKDHGMGKAQEETANSYASGTVSVSLSQLYPFGEKAEISERMGSGSGGVAKKFMDLMEWLTYGTEKYLVTVNPLSTSIASSLTVLNDLFKNDVFLNGTSSFVKLPKDYLTECFDYCPSPESMDHILDFSTWLENQGIPFVALIQPEKSDDSIAVFPEGIPHGYSKMLDEYKAFLDENKIKYIEAKPILLAENEDLYSWFYKADHHWNVRAGYKMADETARFLNDKLSVPTDTGALDKSNFKLTVYPDSFLGSYGKKLGDEWKEDLEIYYPVGETEFRVEIPTGGYDRTGSFADTLIDQSLLQEGDTSYAALFRGGPTLVRVENKNCKNGTRLLVIQYSFGNALCPYLANTVQYLDMIDPRSFDGSICSFVTQTKPDAVILCMGVPTEDDEQHLHLK